MNNSDEHEIQLDEHESFLMVEHESFLLMLWTIAFLSQGSPNFLSWGNIRIRTKNHNLSPVNSSLFSEILKMDAQQFNSPMSRKEEQSCRQFSPMSKRLSKSSSNLSEIQKIGKDLSPLQWEHWMSALVGKSQEMVFEECSCLQTSNMSKRLSKSSSSFPMIHKVDARVCFHDNEQNVSKIRYLVSAKSSNEQNVRAKEQYQQLRSNITSWKSHSHRKIGGHTHIHT